MNALTDADYVDVKLTAAEVLLASHVGCMRNVQSLKMANEPEHPDEKEWWNTNIIGALGELVIAKHFNLFWTGAVGDWKARDVYGLEVKTNQLIYPRKNILMIKKKRAKPDAPYFLVAGSDFNYRIFGWIHGSDIIKEERFSDPCGKNRPCYHMDATELNPLKEFNFKQRS
tara:strand:- start:548 stop:1060 length:513 start_codon:yes stop_codon:yes gene_type:complete